MSRCACSSRAVFSQRKEGAIRTLEQDCNYDGACCSPSLHLNLLPYPSKGLCTTQHVPMHSHPRIYSSTSHHISASSYRKKASTGAGSPPESAMNAARGTFRDAFPLQALSLDPNPCNLYQLYALKHQAASGCGSPLYWNSVCSAEDKTLAWRQAPRRK